LSMCGERKGNERVELRRRGHGCNADPKHADWLHRPTCCFGAALATPKLAGWQLRLPTRNSIITPTRPKPSFSASIALVLPIYQSSSGSCPI
jgi:hypothetical protein